MYVRDEDLAKLKANVRRLLIVRRNLIGRQNS